MDKEKRKRATEDYFGLVEVVIKDMLGSPKFRTFRHLEDDLMGHGYESLMLAIDSYKPGKGMTPVSYLSFKIRGRTKDYLKKYVREAYPLCDLSSTGFDNLVAEENVEFTDEDYALVDKYEPSRPDDKVIYNQIILGGDTHAEVAKELGRSKGAIKFRTYDLKKKIRKEMIKGEGIED